MPRPTHSRPAALGGSAATLERADRRRHPRRRITRPCKIFRPLTRRYAAACTRDASDGGILIELDAARPIAAGERLDIGIAWSSAPLLSHDRLTPGTVVRTTEIGQDRQAIAIRFDA